MNIHLIILGFLSIAHVLLASWLLARYQRSAGVNSLAAFLFGLSSISLVTALYQLSLQPQILLWVARFGYVFGVYTFAMLLLFSWNYPFPAKGAPRNQTNFWLVPLAFFVPLIFFSKLFLKEIIVFATQRRESVGSLYWLFPLTVSVYFVWAIINLFRKISYLEGVHLRRMRVFVVVLVICAITGIIFDVLLPAVSEKRGPYGIELSMALVAVSSYIAFRKEIK